MIDKKIKTLDHWIDKKIKKPRIIGLGAPDSRRGLHRHPPSTCSPSSISFVGSDHYHDEGDYNFDDNDDDDDDDDDAVDAE